MTKVRVVTTKQQTREGHEVEMIVYAREDGMIIGSVSQGGTQFGEEPSKAEIRCFLTNEDAKAYVMQQCCNYYGREDIDFVHESATPLVKVVGNLPRVRMQ